MEQNNSLIAELNEKIALLEEIQNINKIGYWELYLENNKVKWSDMVYDIHELPRNTNINKTQGINFYHPDYREIVSKAAENCIVNAEPFNIECKLISYKKNEKWVRATGRKVGDKLIGSFQDVSEIKKQELKFKGIFNSTFTFIGFLDTNGILLEANDTAVNMAGIQHSDVIGKHFWDCYWWQISKQAQEELKVNFQKALSGEVVEYEVAVWVANQVPVTILFSLKPVFDDNGKVIYVIPEGRPVQELVDARRRYKSVLEGTSVGTWEWNVQTGETVFDERWAEIVGYTLEELAPTTIDTWTKFVHPEDLEESGKKLKDCFEGNTGFYELETRMKHKDGHWVWVYDRGKVLEWTEEGKPLMMYGTHQDISKRKNAEEEVRRTSILLESAERITKMGAWELNTVTGETFWTDGVYKIHEVENDFDHNKANGIDFYHPDYRPIITNAITDSIEKQIPFDVRCKFITAKNNLLWVRASGYPIVKNGKTTHLIGMFRDITLEEADKEAIIHAQAYSKQLIENMADGFSVIDSEGKQLSVNRAFCEMTGFSESELLYQTAPYPYWPEEELENIGKAFQKTLSGKGDSFELIFKKKSGDRFPVLLSLAELKNSDGKVVNYFANIQDITERKQKEEALRISEEAFRGNFENAAVGMAIISPKGKWQKVNRKICEIVGYPAEELMQLTFQDITHPDDLDIDLGLLRELVEGKRDHYQMEKRYFHKDGHIVYIILAVSMVKNERGKVLHFISQIIDITPLKRTEKRLKTLLTEYRALMDATTEVAFISTDKEGIIEEINIGVEKLLGYTSDQVKGLSIKDLLFLEKECEEASNALVKNNSGKVETRELLYALAKESKNREWTFIKNDGSMMDGLVSVTVIYLEEKPTKYLFAAINISHIKSIQEQLKQKNEELEQFAYIAAHDMKEPLRGITTYLSILQKKYSDRLDEKANLYINNAYDNANRMKTLITDILDFSRTGKIGDQPVNLNTLLDSIIDNYQGDDNINAIISRSEMPTLRGDASSFVQLFTNLIDNGIKYQPKGQTPEIKIEATESGKWWVFTVTDNGIGINPEHQDKVFEIFKRLHSISKYSGTGIGLATCKKIVTAYGGKIWFEPVEPIGTVFKFTIPK